MLGCSGDEGQAHLSRHRAHVWNQGRQNGWKSLHSASLLALHTRFRYMIKDLNDIKNSLKSAKGHVRVFWWRRSSTFVTSQGAGMKSRASKWVQKHYILYSPLALNTIFRYIIKGLYDGNNSLRSASGHVRVFWWRGSSTLVTSQGACQIVVKSDFK